MPRLGTCLVVWIIGCNSEEKACDAFVDDITVCYDDYCSDDGNPAFCDCWDQGMDVDITTCDCAPLNLAAACEVLDLSDYEAGDANCSAAGSAIDNICTGE